MYTSNLKYCLFHIIELEQCLEVWEHVFNASMTSDQGSHQGSQGPWSLFSLWLFQDWNTENNISFCISLMNISNRCSFYLFIYLFICILYNQNYAILFLFKNKRVRKKLLIIPSGKQSSQYFSNRGHCHLFFNISLGFCHAFINTIFRKNTKEALINVSDIMMTSCKSLLFFFKSLDWYSLKLFSDFENVFSLCTR